MNNIDNNIYKLGYNLLISAFAEDNLELGLLNALQLIQQCFQGKEVSIYKINNNKVINSYSYPNDDYDFVINFFNKHKNLLKNKLDYDFKINDQVINRLTWFNIDNNKYLLVIINGNFRDNILYNPGIEKIKKALCVILKQEKMVENLIESSTIDGLTGLLNRLAFNKKVEEYNNNSTNITFTILDLFRLKNINDKYGHIVGDLYIKNSAEILKRFFPKYRYNYLTGDSVYRIGGDEFVVISEKKDIMIIKDILQKIEHKIKSLDLGIEKDEDVYLDINYGISERNNNQKIEELYILADSELSLDKKSTYKQLKINRRK